MGEGDEASTATTLLMVGILQKLASMKPFLGGMDGRQKDISARVDKVEDAVGYEVMLKLHGLERSIDFRLDGRHR